MKYTQKLFVRKVKPISNLYINSVLIFITISSNIEYEKRSIADKTVRYRGQQTRNRDSPISSMHFGRFNPQFGKLYHNQRSNYHHHYSGFISSASRPWRPWPPIKKIHTRDQEAGKGGEGWLSGCPKIPINTGIASDKGGYGGSPTQRAMWADGKVGSALQISSMDRESNL